MKFIRFCILICFAVLFSSFVFGQSNLKVDKYISKTFWLRHNLVLSGEVKVYPNNIEFEETDGKIVNRGEMVKIKSIKREQDFSKVKFSAKDSTYELLVQSNSKKNFQKSFELAFSPKPIKESLVNWYCESKMKTKADLLKCYGFPLRIDKDEENNVEIFHYTCWFLNHCSSLDTYEIKIKNGKIVDITGLI
ncbi:hypothetical protein BH20ACI1_BH20ACI1_20520 [soil metagenome]